MNGGGSDPRLTGRIGGLTAWARNDPGVLLGPAHRAFRLRFERLVDPDGTLPEHERQARADRALRAHMLGLAARSARARRIRSLSKKAPGSKSRNDTRQA